MPTSCERRDKHFKENTNKLLKHASKNFRKAKAQLELNIDTVVKDNKKFFYKYIKSKRKAKKDHYSLLDVTRKVTTEDKEKDEVLSAFFTSVFNSQTSYP